MYFNSVKSLFFFNSIFSLNAGCAKCCPCCRDRDNSTVLNLDRNRYKGKINNDPDKNVKSEKIEDTDKNIAENLKTDKNIDENVKIYENINENVKPGKTLVKIEDQDKDIDDNVNDEDLNENVKPGKTLVNNVNTDKNIILYEDVGLRIPPFFTDIPIKYIKDCYEKVDKNFIPKGLRRKGFSCYFLALM